MNKAAYSTLSFLFILIYVNAFESIFGSENSIVAVIFIIMMFASMARDLTAEPVRHLIVQTAVLVWMAVAAYWTVTLPAILSFPVNFITLLMILYAYTYEYANHIYFPYVLSYLFLIFISPVNAAQLSGRMMAMAAGAVSIILYQWFMGRNRVVETARDVLSKIIDSICSYISFRLDRSGQPEPSDTRRLLCRLSQTVYERRKKVLCVSEASFSMIAAGRGLDHLLTQLTALPEVLTNEEKSMLSDISSRLQTFRSFLHQEITELPLLPSAAQYGADEKTAASLYGSLAYIHDSLTHMTDPRKKDHYRKTALNLKIRLQAALDFSPVRAAYALRTALLLSCATLLVQTLALPHGKWLVFTLASLSMPYADDVPSKIHKRIAATMIGGLVSVAIYSLIPSPAGRTFAMMMSGYLSFYFTDYRDTFACSTVGALGGAVFMDAFGFPAVTGMFLIRIGYILAGAAVAYAVNCLIFPYSRARATRQLWEKFKETTELLTKMSRSDRTDPQLYYHLVIRAHMMEEKLTHNAYLEKWEDFPRILAEYREKIRLA